jgi:hypothetical protein
LAAKAASMTRQRRATAGRESSSRFEGEARALRLRARLARAAEQVGHRRPEYCGIARGYVARAILGQVLVEAARAGAHDRHARGRRLEQHGHARAVRVGQVGDDHDVRPGVPPQQAPELAGQHEAQVSAPRRERRDESAARQERHLEARVAGEGVGDGGPVAAQVVAGRQHAHRPRRAGVRRRVGAAPCEGGDRHPEAVDVDRHAGQDPAQVRGPDFRGDHQGVGSRQDAAEEPAPRPRVARPFVADPDGLAVEQRACPRAAQPGAQDGGHELALRHRPHHVRLGQEPPVAPEVVQVEPEHAVGEARHQPMQPLRAAVDARRDQKSKIGHLVHPPVGPLGALAGGEQPRPGRDGKAARVVQHEPRLPRRRR